MYGYDDDDDNVPRPVSTRWVSEGDLLKSFKSVPDSSDDIFDRSSPRTSEQSSSRLHEQSSWSRSRNNEAQPSSFNSSIPKNRGQSSSAATSSAESRPAESTSMKPNDQPSNFGAESRRLSSFASNRKRFESTDKTPAEKSSVRSTFEKSMDCSSSSVADQLKMLNDNSSESLQQPTRASNISAQRKSEVEKSDGDVDIKTNTVICF